MVHRFQQANTLARGAFALFGVYLAAISLSSVGAEEARWVDPIQGLWHDGAMWSTNPARPNNGQPDANSIYDVVIDAVGADYTVDLDAHATVDSVIIDSPNATLNHINRNLTTSLIDVRQGTYQWGVLNVGYVSITDALIQESGGDFVMGTRPIEHRLDNVRLAADIDATRSLKIKHDLTLVDGAVITVSGMHGRFTFNTASGKNGAWEDQTLGGQGQVILAANGFSGISKSGLGILTIGDEIDFWIQASNHNIKSESGFVNYGTIHTDPGSVVNLWAPDARNYGTLDIAGRLRVERGNGVEAHEGNWPEDDGGVWVNEGTVRVRSSGRLELGGTFTMDDLGTLITDPGAIVTVHQGGVLDNSGRILDMSNLPFSQPLSFTGGTLRGGTLTSDQVVHLTDWVRFDNVTLAADLERSNAIGELGIINNLVLQDANINIADGHGFAFHYNNGLANVLSGRGTITATGSLEPREPTRIGGYSLRIGPDVTIQSIDDVPLRKLELIFDTNEGSIVLENPDSESVIRMRHNSGRIVVDAPNGSVTIDRFNDDPDRKYYPWKNDGVIELNSGQLFLRELEKPSDIGTVEMNGGVLEIGNIRDAAGETLRLGNSMTFNGNLENGNIEIIQGATTSISGDIHGDLFVAGHLTGGASIHGDLFLDGGTITIRDGKAIGGMSAVTGNGRIILDEVTKNSGIREFSIFAYDGLTLGAGIVLETGSNGGGNVYGNDYRATGIVNYGTIHAHTPGQSIGVWGMLNNGTVSATNNSTIYTSYNHSTDSPPTGGIWHVETPSQILFSDQDSLGTQFHPDDHIIVDFGEHVLEAPIQTEHSLKLAGSLEVRMSGSYIPRTDHPFPIFSSYRNEEGFISGNFTEVSLPDLPEGFTWDATQLPITGALLVDGPAPTVIAQTRFAEPKLGTFRYAPGPNGQELGFTTSVSPSNGADSFAGVVAEPSASASRGLLFRSMIASTTFETIDLSSFVTVELDVNFQISPTNYEDRDFIRFTVTDGMDEIEIVNIFGDQIERLAVTGTLDYSVIIPDSWQQATVVYSSFNNSSVGAESFLLDSIQFSGYEASLFRRGLNGSGETYFENFDAALGTRTGQLPAGWQAENDSGVTRQIDSLGLNDGPLGNDGTSFLVNVGGSPERFGTIAPQRVATWKDDLNGDSSLGPEDIIADGHTDRALGNSRAASDDPGTLSFSIPIAGNPLRAFTIDWDLEVWGGDPLAARRGGDGAGYAAELKVGGVTYYENRKTLFPGELFDTAFDGGADNRNPTLIDGNTHAVRSVASDIIEVDITDGAVGNLIELSFNANHGPDAGGWIQAIDNVQLRALAPGDADASGTVDTDDLLTLLAGRTFNQGVDGVTWTQGDFNADDEFNTDDLLAILSFLSGTFPSNPYASEASGSSDAVANVTVNSQTGEVSVFLAGNQVSSVIIDSAAEIFHVSDTAEVDWNTSGLFESASAGQISNTLFTSTLTGSNQLGQVISEEFLNGDFQFKEDLTVQIYAYGADGDLGALDVEISVVPEPSTFVLTLLGATFFLACGRRFSSPSRMIGIRP